MQEGVLVGAFRNPEFNSTAARPVPRGAGGRQGALHRPAGRHGPRSATARRSRRLAGPAAALLARRRPRPRTRAPRAGAGAGFLPAPAGRDRLCLPASLPKPATAGRRRAPSEVGIDEAALTRVVQKLDRRRSIRPPSLADPFAAGGAARQARARRVFLRLRSRHGRTTLRSAGKTFASVMLGAAMMQGAEDRARDAGLRSARRQGPVAQIPIRASRGSRSRI